MIHSGHKTLVHYPDDTSKIVTLYARPLEGQIIVHGWEVTNVAPGEDDALKSRSSTRSRSHARRTSFGRRTFRLHRDPQSCGRTGVLARGAGRLAERRQCVAPTSGACLPLLPFMGSVRILHGTPPRPIARYEPRMFTARAATRRIVIAEIADSAPIIALARSVRGIVSVGLNAIEFVNET
jgi:hypothetical protein